MQATEAGSLIDQKTIILSVTMTAITNRAKIEPGELGLDGVDEKMVHASKELMQSDELRALRLGDYQLRRWLKKHTLPCLLKRGMYLVPLDEGTVAKTEERLQRHATERGLMADEFIDAVPVRVAEAKQRLGPMFNLADYPGVEADGDGYRVTASGRVVMRGLFTCHYQYLEVTPAGKLGSISAEAYKREQEKARVGLAELATRCRTVLLAEFQHVVNHLVERLTPKEDGTRKKFRNAMVPNFLEALELVRARELTNDAELRQALDAAAALVAGVDSEYLRDVPEAADKVRAQGAKVRARIEEMIEAAPTRYMEW